MHSTTINDAEIKRFNAISDEWWDPKGQFKPLHEMIPHRMEYLLSCFKDGVKDLNILDVGCGGGLTAEPLTRLGAKVTGIDAEENTLNIAKKHAADMELEIDYQLSSVEELADKDKTYDAVLALEIIEHVDEVPLFCEQLVKMVKPGGTLILSTLNRTMMSYAKAIVAAEYLFRWVPRGTHEWQKFMKPAEMVNLFEALEMDLHSLKGLSYYPLTQKWGLSHDVSVNYFACFKKGL